MSVWHHVCSTIVSSESVFSGSPDRRGGRTMARGDKSSYSEKQKRKAEHIAEGYRERGVSPREAKRRAWATVNKESGGGKRSGSGRGKKESHVSSHRGGKASASRSAAERSASARKAARTRKRRGH